MITIRTSAGNWFVIREPDRTEWLQPFVYLAAILIILLTIIAAMKAYGI